MALRFNPLSSEDPLNSSWDSTSVSGITHDGGMPALTYERFALRKGKPVQQKVGDFGDFIKDILTKSSVPGLIASNLFGDSDADKKKKKEEEDAKKKKEDDAKKAAAAAASPSLVDDALKKRTDSGSNMWMWLVLGLLLLKGRR